MCRGNRSDPSQGRFYPITGPLVNISLLCLMTVVGAAPTASPDGSAICLYRPAPGFQAAIRHDDAPPLVVRGQSSVFLTSGATSPPAYTTQDVVGITGPLGSASASDGGLGTTSPYGAALPPPYQTYQQPFGGTSGDPWIGGSTVPAPNADPFGTGSPGLYTFGFNGAQPYRYGWSARYDVGIIADEGTTSPFGSLGGWGIFEVDTEKELVTPIWNNYVFAIAPQFSYRAWEGPSFNGIVGGAAPGFHGSLYRLGLGLKLATPDYGGWNTEIGFNPAYATDFDNTDFSDAMQWDGHAVLFWRVSQEWMWAFGAAYWDRVDDLVVPYAGAVWTPNQLWEFRLVLPEPRISLFLGTPFAVPTWLYVRGEYHVESYAVEIEPTVGADLKIQVEDWRVLGGVRSETGAVTTFAEVGWVFERDAKLDVSGLKGQLHSGLIGRVGLRY